jgi:hypothetical protein
MRPLNSREGGVLVKIFFLTLHHGLQAIGRVIGQLASIALGVALVLASISAVIAASMYMAVGVVKLTGGGAFVIFLLFWIFVSLIAWYVAPHVQPKIREALRALLHDDKRPVVTPRKTCISSITQLFQRPRITILRTED